MNWVAVSLFFGIFFAILLTAVVLAQKADRVLTAVVMVLALFAAVGKVWLFQQAPQWRDFDPDAHRYELNALAFVQHWKGNDVSSKAYALQGLEDRHDTTWTHDERLPYSGVIGSADWLYTAYVGLWYKAVGPSREWAIYSNTAFAAFFPVAAFFLALLLSGRRRDAWWAGALTLLDPSAGVNASWLIKDSLVGFIAMAALWAGVDYIRKRRYSSLGILLITLGALGASRFVAFLTLLIALVPTVGVCLWLRHHGRVALALTTGAVGAMVVSGCLYYFPQPPVGKSAIRQAWSVVSVVSRPALGGVDVFDAGKNAENSVLGWRRELRQDPLHAMLRSVAHTLFAPYPWVAIYPGLTWHAFSELYYPGMLLWIACLPGIFAALVLAVREHRRDPAWWLVSGFLYGLVAVYTIFLGEFSTRQRVFVLPAFFALGAIGWAELTGRWRAARG